MKLGEEMNFKFIFIFVLGVTLSLNSMKSEDLHDFACIDSILYANHSETESSTKLYNKLQTYFQAIIKDAEDNEIALIKCFEFLSKMNNSVETKHRLANFIRTKLEKSFSSEDDITKYFKALLFNYFLALMCKCDKCSLTANYFSAKILTEVQDPKFNKIYYNEKPDLNKIYSDCATPKFYSMIYFLLSLRQVDVNFEDDALKQLNVNFRDALDQTILIKLVRYTDCPIHIVNFLLDKGIDVNADDIYSRTALIWAAKRNKLNLVKFFLERCYNIDLDSQDFLGKTALMYASVNGNFEMVNLLLDYGAASLDISDIFNKTSLDYFGLL